MGLHINQNHIFSLSFACDREAKIQNSRRIRESGEYKHLIRLLCILYCLLQIFDDIIFAFFALEMTIKMVAMGIYGKNTYLADSWNRLDFFIVLAGLLEYVMHVENLNLTAIRTIRVLRPLRAINRIPSEYESEQFDEKPF